MSFNLNVLSLCHRSFIVDPLFQVVYICGVVYGSYYSADITNAAFPIRSVSVNHALIGGVLLSFGSLMCGGSIRYVNMFSTG